MLDCVAGRELQTYGLHLASPSGEAPAVAGDEVVESISEPC
jgi:hypothetical protein